jgi:hypothetical protein
MTGKIMSPRWTDKHTSEHERGDGGVEGEVRGLEIQNTRYIFMRFAQRQT